MTKRYRRSRSRRSRKSSPGFARRHKKKLIAALGITGAIAAAYMGGVSVATLTSLFNKSSSYVHSAIARGKELASQGKGLAAGYFSQGKGLAAGYYFGNAKSKPTTVKSKKRHELIGYGDI